MKSPLFGTSRTNSVGPGELAKPRSLPPGVEAEAVFGGPLDQYRYMLCYRLKHARSITRNQTIMWLMMNPSTASHEVSDATVLRCWGMSQQWGYRRMYVGNAAAYRATDSRRLGGILDPVGPDNHKWLLKMASKSCRIVVAHGKPKTRKAHTFGPEAVQLLRDNGHILHVLALSKDGIPKHPLYLPNSLVPTRWERGDRLFD